MDVDYDIKPGFIPKNIFSVVYASKVDNGNLKKHNVGVYFQKIPEDRITGVSAIPYKDAEELGYMKIDFLNLNLLSFFKTSRDVEVLANKEPNWNMLTDKNKVKKLFHIGNHYGLINKIKPRSVEDLSDCLALRLPVKRHLVDYYLSDRDSVREVLFEKTDEYYFKKSHAIAYAKNIVICMHLVEYGII